MLTFSQIIAKIDRVCGSNSTSYPTADKTVDINLALLEVYQIALKNGGWNIDDFNWTHDPFITTNLVAGQRDYHFVYDEDGALILDIYKVMVKVAGVFKEITPVDTQSIAPTTMIDGQDTQGTPTTYDKTGNGIFLDVIPSASVTNGLKVFISREPTMFLSSDTTKVAGIDGLCHDYLYLKPAYEYARDNDPARAERLYRDLQDAKKRIDDRYGRRQKDIVARLIPLTQNNK